MQPQYENSVSRAAEDFPRLPVEARVGFGFFACLFSLLAYWMFYIVQNFLDGNGWWDWIVGFVLHDLIVSIWLFSLGMLIIAIFDPQWIRYLFLETTKKLFWAIGIFFFLLVAVTFVVIFVLPILEQLGLI